MINLKIDQNNTIAVNLYKKRNDQKLVRYKNNKTKELNNAKEVSEYFKAVQYRKYN